ncbi:MAG: ABC transporter ATP-binding protein [Chloroflexota bacterium]
MGLPLKQYFSLLSTYLEPLRQKVALLAVLLFSSIGLQLWAPQILRDFIDQTQTDLPIADLMQIAVIFLVVSLFAQVVKVIAAYITQDIRWRTTNQMRGDLAAHCMTLDMSFHNAQTPGKMIERIDGDVNELSNFFSQFIVQIVGNLVLLTGILFLLFREDWRIGLTFLIFTLFTSFVIGRTVGIAVPFWRENRQATSELFGFLEERLAGTEDIRSSGGVAYTLQQLRQAIITLFQSSRKAWTIGELTWGATDALFSLGMAIALALGGYLLMIDAISLGTVYLIFHYNTMIRRPVDQLTRQLKDLQSAGAGIERIQALFDTYPKVQVPTDTEAQPIPAGPLSVVFDQVQFGYVSEEPVLQNVSFHLEPGQVLGILGRTGSGKTTITRLLFRLYDIDKGSIRLGDVPLQNTQLSDLRQRIGIVTQDVQLFEAQVRDNLTFFDDAISDDALHTIIYNLGLESWYQTLADGLDTVLAGSNGGLSAGEAQLLAFARVFLKEPGLIILDEASSRLDPATEQLIEQAIDRLLFQRTGIIIAHRLATVQRADKILILEAGQIVEFGDRVALAADPTSRFAQLLKTGMTEMLA